MRIFATAAVVWFALVTSAYAGDPIPGLYNYFEHSPELVTSGQPARNQFDALKSAGVEVVVNMAPADLPASLKDEQKLVESRGMKYVFIPVDWDRPSTADVKRFFQVMDENRNRKVLAHCWMNARASAFAYLYRVAKEHKSEPEERAVLERIWSNNKGYELRNVPSWQAFLKRALAEAK